MTPVGMIMTTSVVIKNNGPGLITVRTHYLDAERQRTGSYHGQDIPSGAESTFTLHRGVQLSIDEIIPGKRTV